MTAATLIAASLAAAACDAPAPSDPTATPRSAMGEPRRTRTPKPVVRPSPRPTVASFANCADLRRVYPAGVPSDLPAYRPALDRDRDGWACETSSARPTTRSPSVTVTPAPSVSASSSTPTPIVVPSRSLPPVVQSTPSSGTTTIS